LKHRRISRRRTALAGAGVGALVATALTFRSANAGESPVSPAPKSLSAPAAGRLATALLGELGTGATGTHYDARNKNLVVNVLDETAARSVEKAGATAGIVENPLADLKRARTALRRDAALPGTSWVTGPTADKVVVTADRTVSGAAWAKLTEVVESLGAKAGPKRTAGEYRPFAAGGDAITGSGGRRSLGFDVAKGGEPYFLAAGHRTGSSTSWSDSSGTGTGIGENEVSGFPGDGHGLVKYTADVDHPGEADLYDGSAQPSRAPPRPPSAWR
jgi:streptogrisin D